MKTFSSTDGNGKPILRHFCPECGSSLAEESVDRPGMPILNIGTFDDPRAVKPGREILRYDALPWVHIASAALCQTADMIAAEIVDSNNAGSLRSEAFIATETAPPLPRE